MSEFNERNEELFEDECEEVLDVGGAVRNPLTQNGEETTKNKYDTKKNHMISIACMLILAALIPISAYRIVQTIGKRIGGGASGACIAVSPKFFIPTLLRIPDVTPTA
jgi:hypothetical protein